MAAVVSDVSLSIACSGIGVGKPQIGFVKYNCVALTPGNLAAQITALAAVAAALSPLTNGVVASDALTIGVSISAGLPGGVAVRGDKWAITAQESTGDLNKFTYTIPAADTSGGHVIAGTRAADLTNADWAAYVTAFDAMAKSPAGNALSIISAQAIGRRR